MLPCVFIIFSLLFLNVVETTTANQLVAVEGRGGDDTNGVAKKCLDMERDALLHFKAGLEDPNGGLSTWTAKQDDCCNWIGVMCIDKTGHVTGLSLSSWDIGGEIRDSLLNLSYLNHLDLSFNSFHGAIPTFIGSMTRLRLLELGSNHFNGTIPSSIGNLTNLQWLYLGDVGRCRVENMDWLSHLSHLEDLELDGISLAKANHWVNTVTSLQNLSYLSLDGCELSQVMYPYSSLPNSSSSISSLYLGNNNLTSSMYRWLYPLTSNNLRELSLSSNMLDGVPKHFGNLCSLEILYFDNNSVVVKFPNLLKNLSGCTSVSLTTLCTTGSQFTGSLSDDIQKFSSLTNLNLSQNHLNGTISEKVWELPRILGLDLSSNYLGGAISANIGKSKARFIDLSKNSLLEGVPFADHMSSDSYLKFIYLSSCKLGPHFPKWVQTLKNLSHLDISNNGISDTIPLGFWKTWPSQLEHLNLSSNNISGKIPDFSSNFDYQSAIDLSSNSFYGSIQNVPSSLRLLNLSKNKFNGGIYFLCQLVDGLLEFLDLSHNFLSGKLPDCLWRFKELQILNLGNNNLSGRLPTSVGSLIKLEVLDLYKNDFHGELPLSLKNCTSINSLNLGANKFSGNVPLWIGENLSRLYVLILRSNFFFGTIPLQLCHLANLQILDLSINHLHGTIPSCFNNLTNMVQAGFLLPPNIHSIFIAHSMTSYFREYVDHAMIEWQGDEREFFATLRLLKSIDISSNSLTGEIPSGITNLYDLVALNLSNNALLGEIPLQIGEMKNLLALDLSRNSLSGGIPSSMSRMTFLSYLDVSSNDLSGRIPSSTQLQSFEPSRYDGNLGLCGPPLTKNGPGDEHSKVPPVIGQSEEDKNEVWGWFYIGGGMGFVTGFWIACGTLLLNRRGTHAFFHFYDSLRDWAYVKVMVFIANLQRVGHT